MGRDRNDRRGAMNGRAGAVLLLALMVVGLLTACLRENEAKQQQAKALLYSGVATGMRHNTLMDAAFGSENEWVGADGVYWQVVLPLPQPPQGQQASSQALVSASAAMPAERIENRLMAVRPREAVRLNETQMALVVESEALSALQAQGRLPAASAASAASADAAVARRNQTAERDALPMHIGVIFFQAQMDKAAPPGSGKEEPGQEKWRAVRVMPHVGYLLPQPMPPDVQIYKLDASRYLVTYTQTSCHAGACSRWLKGYLLQPDAMSDVFSIRLAASNVQQHADCRARLGLAPATTAGTAASGLAAIEADLYAHAADAQASQPSVAAAAKASVAQEVAQAASDKAADANPKVAAHACYLVGGEVHLISRARAETADVHIRYSGARSDAAGKLHRIAQTQRFRLQGQSMLQVGGDESPFVDGQDK